MASERVARKSRLSDTEIEQRLLEAFSSAAPSYQVPAKVIAPRIGVSTATVESLRQRVPQSWVTLVMAGRALPAFGLEVMDAMNIDIDQDRAAFAEFLSLQRRIRGQ